MIEVSGELVSDLNRPEWTLYACPGRGCPSNKTIQDIEHDADIEHDSIVSRSNGSFGPHRIPDFLCDVDFVRYRR
jgi:hypothetical protein